MLQVQNPFQTLNDKAGQPLDAGYVYIGTANLNPETNPVTVYWDEAGTQPAAQPLRTTAGYIVRSGTPARVYIGVDDYSITVRQSNRALVYSALSATSLYNLEVTLATSAGASMIGFIQAGTGAVLRTLQAKAREPYVTPEDFGATGDGIADDHAEVVLALATGRDLFLPDGKTYIVTGVSVSTANQRVFGRGKLKLKNASNAATLKILANGVKVEDIAIDGNKANQTTTTDGSSEGIYIGDGYDDIVVMDTRISDTKMSGIAGYGNSTNVRVYDNEIKRPGFIGIRPSEASGRPATRWKIRGNDVEDPGQDGIGTVGMQHCSILGNTVVNPVIAGIALEARCDYTTVVGNTIKGAGAADTASGIQVNDSKGVTVSGNTLYGMGVGIVASGGNTSNDVTIQGNTLDYCGASNCAINVDGSSAQSPAFQDCYKYGASVVGNTIRNSYRSAILLNGVQGVTVSGNQIHTFATAADATTAGRFLAGIALRSYSCYNTIEANTISDSSGDAKRIGVFEVNDGGQAPSNNYIINNTITGLVQDVCVTFSGTNQSTVERPQRSTSAPTAYTWARGQAQMHAYPASAGYIGFVSTDSRGGSFGTYSTTGAITSGTALLTVVSTDGLFDGMSVTVAGAGVAAANLNTVVSSVNRTTKVVTLVDNASTTVGPTAAVTLYNPTFKTWGLIS